MSPLRDSQSPPALPLEPRSADPDAAGLLEAFTLARLGSPQSTDQLYTAAHDYAKRLRQQGLLVEQVIVRLKLSIEAAGLRDRNFERDRLVDVVITQCIQAYYRE